MPTEHATDHTHVGTTFVGFKGVGSSVKSCCLDSCVDHLACLEIHSACLCTGHEDLRAWPSFPFYNMRSSGPLQSLGAWKQPALAKQCLSCSCLKSPSWHALLRTRHTSFSSGLQGSCKHQNEITLNRPPPLSGISMPSSPAINAMSLGGSPSFALLLTHVPLLLDVGG